MNTGKVKRRALRLATLDAMVAEAERLAAAERDGRLRRGGNWSLGQMFGHVAGWADVAYDGYPKGLPRPPWLVRMLLPMFKKRFLTKGLPAGMKMRGIEGGTKFCEPLATDEGLARLRRSAKRLGKQEPTVPNAVFGPMTREEVAELTLRHAELHLSFVSVE